MPSNFDKLNLKRQREIVVINAPASFEPELDAFKDVAVPRDVKKEKAIDFAIAFATRQAEVDALSKALGAKTEGDALLWFAPASHSNRRDTRRRQVSSTWPRFTVVQHDCDSKLSGFPALPRMTPV